MEDIRLLRIGRGSPPDVMDNVHAKEKASRNAQQR